MITQLYLSWINKHCIKSCIRNNFMIRFTQGREVPMRVCVLYDDEPYGFTPAEFLKKFDLPANDFNSFILAEEDKIYTRSTAALRIAKQLSGGWKLLYGLIIIPGFLRNAVYNWIAKNRYKWFGKKDDCMIPTPELKERFLD